RRTGWPPWRRPDSAEVRRAWDLSNRGSGDANESFRAAASVFVELVNVEPRRLVGDRVDPAFRVVHGDPLHLGDRGGKDGLDPQFPVHHVDGGRIVAGDPQVAALRLVEKAGVIPGDLHFPPGTLLHPLVEYEEKARIPLLEDVE